MLQTSAVLVNASGAAPLRHLWTENMDDMMEVETKLLLGLRIRQQDLLIVFRGHPFSQRCKP